MKHINTKIARLIPEAEIPKRASPGAVGFDIYACRILNKDSKEPEGELPYTLLPGESVLIGSGVAFSLPLGYQSEVRPRSGLATIYDIELSNSPGTIDPDFRGEAGILLRNRGKSPFVIEQGMRVAQLIFTEAVIPVFEEVKELSDTLRGTGGFGSTGLFEIGLGTEEYDLAIAQRDWFYMKIAIAASERSNCMRGVPKDSDGRYRIDERGRFINQTRKFGCVIEKGDNVVAVGWNAQYPGSPLCSEVGCLREAEGIASGTRLERCRAIHAEQMAILKMLSSGVGTPTEGATMYVTAEPCELCSKEIAGMGIDTLVVLAGVYPTHGLEIIKQADINIRYVLREDLD